jgi:hypothetical protein
LRGWQQKFARAKFINLLLYNVFGNFGARALPSACPAPRAPFLKKVKKMRNCHQTVMKRL